MVAGQLLAARAFSHPDAFPAGDLGLRRTAGRLLGRDVPPAERELVTLAGRWSPYRTTAAAYLWFDGQAKSTEGGAA